MLVLRTSAAHNPSEPGKPFKGPRPSSFMAEVRVKLDESVARHLGDSPEKSAAELIAVELYRENRLTLRQAAKVAGVPAREMEEVLARRRIYVNYGEAELDEDLRHARGQ